MKFIEFIGLGRKAVPGLADLIPIGRLTHAALRQRKRPTPRSGPATTLAFSFQMGSQDGKELSRGDYPDPSILLREVTGVAGDNVFCPSLQRALENLVVVGITGDLELLLRLNDNSRMLNRPQGPCNLSWVESEAGPAQYLFVLFEKGIGDNKCEASRQGQINEQGFSTSALQEGGDDDIRVQNSFNGRHGGAPGEYARSPGRFPGGKADRAASPSPPFGWRQ